MNVFSLRAIMFQCAPEEIFLGDFCGHSPHSCCANAVCQRYNMFLRLYEPCSEISSRTECICVSMRHGDDGQLHLPYRTTTQPPYDPVNHHQSSFFLHPRA